MESIMKGLYLLLNIYISGELANIALIKILLIYEFNLIK